MIHSKGTYAMLQSTMSLSFVCERFGQCSQFNDAYELTTHKQVQRCWRLSLMKRHKQTTWTCNASDYNQVKRRLGWPLGWKETATCHTFTRNSVCNDRHTCKHKHKAALLVERWKACQHYHPLYLTLTTKRKDMLFAFENVYTSTYTHKQAITWMSSVFYGNRVRVIQQMSFQKQTSSAQPNLDAASENK